MSSFSFELPIDSMSKSQKKIANFILKKLEQIPFYTEEDISSGAGVSISTVSRFWHTVGFHNLKAFKKHLHEVQYATPAVKMQNMLDQSKNNVVEQMINSAASYLVDTKERLSLHDFVDAVELIANAGHVYVHAPGSAHCLAQLLSFRLNRIGIQVIIIAEAGHAVYEKLINITENDVLLCFGFVRTSPEINVLLDYAQEIAFKTILITDLLASEMINRCDIVLQVERGARGEFHSLVAPMVIVDSLAVALTATKGEAAFNKLNLLHQLRKQYNHLLPK